MAERSHLQGLHWECFVCGPHNHKGLRLNIKLEGDHTECTFVPTPEYQGPPGITHSGVVAAVLDEVMTQLVTAKLVLAVTRKIEVQYRLPVRVGRMYTVTAEVRGERKSLMVLRAEVKDAEGNVAARARGIYAPLNEERVSRLLADNGAPADAK